GGRVRIGLGDQTRRLLVPMGASCLTPHPIDGPVAGGGNDPARRAWRHTRRRPALNGGREGVLDGFLGKLDVAEAAGQDPNGPTVLLAEDAFDLAGGCQLRHAPVSFRHRPGTVVPRSAG